MEKTKKEKEKIVKKIVLGRGFGALFSDIEAEKDKNNVSKVLEINIEKIKIGVYQPRMYFNKEKLDELKKSISENGIIQPLIVSKSSAGYELIAGERRYRAAKELNYRTVPVIIKDLSGHKALEIALIENIQRQDLNVIEEASCYRRLIEEYNLTHEELSKKIGKDRATITNLIRLLSLPNEVKNRLIDGTISASHARSMVGLSKKETDMILGKITYEKLSVRGTENAAKALKKLSKSNKKPFRVAGNRDFSLYSQIKKYENDLFEKFQTRIKINYKNSNDKLKGKLEINFFSTNDLERIINLLIS